MTKDLRRIVRKRLSAYRPVREITEVVAGRADGTVFVPGTNDKMIYVRRSLDSIPFAVWNKVSQPVAGVHLFIGETDYEPGVLQVVDVPILPGAAGQVITGSVPKHGSTHQWGGSDLIYIDTEQVTGGLVYGGTGLVVNIQSGRAVVGTTLVHWTATTLDLTSYVPTDGEALYGFIRVDVDANFTFQAGSTVSSIGSLTLDDLPELEVGYAYLAAVRLFDSQTVISRQYSDPDVVDMRLVPYSLSTGSGGGGDLYWKVDGTLAATTNAAVPFIAGRTFEIHSVLAYVGTPGSSGSTIIDVELNGVSIFGSQPTVDYDDADQYDEQIPTTIEVSKGDILSLNIDQTAVDAADLVVVIIIGEIEPGDHHMQVLFTVSGVVSVATGSIVAPNHTGKTLTLLGVYLDCPTGSGPTGAALIADIHMDGTTVFTTQANRPQIAAGEIAGYSLDIDVIPWPDGSVLTMDIDQVGSTLPGSNLTVTVVFV